MNLAEQVILITGGANGIGRYLVQDLGPDARKLLVLDKDKAALEDLAAEYDAGAFYTCDLTNYSEVQNTVGSIYRGEHEPTVLINNAGLIHSEPLVNLVAENERKHDIGNWHRTLDANLTSVFYATVCVAEQMMARRTKGLIINMSSISAGGNAGQSAYSAAKAGVNALTVTWSKELGVFGIRSAAIAPGFIDTSSTQTSMNEAQLKSWQKKTPLRRLGKLEEIARAIRFIIGNDFFNGRILQLDGGLKL